METSPVLEKLRLRSRERAHPEVTSLAFAAAYDAFAASLYRYLLTMLSDVAEAEDALQEVFLGLMRRGAQKRIHDMQAYLFRAARNQALMVLRKRRKQDRQSAAAAICWIDFDTSAGQHRELAIDVARALEQLSPEHREVVSLKLGEGLTFREMAQVLGISPNTAASRYRLALKRLRNLLEGGEGHE